MKLPLQTVKFNSDLIKKYNRPTPRYTSYPPATELSDNFSETEYREAIARGNQKKSPLSLYFHIPFCESACYYCGCNIIVTKLKDRVVVPYLNYISQEIDRVSSLIDKDRQVVQLHWGGGTPNYLNIAQVETLWNKINQHFTFDPAAEISLEINPRYVDKNYIFFLRSLGFNRISFGIQDFDPKVQEAVNRVQPEEMLFEVMGWMREAGFESVNVDLIYGLPYQNLSTFKETIQKTIRLNPNRIAVFNFAYLPGLKPIQKKIPQEVLPDASEKLDMFQMTIEELEQAGYVFIGMDHFGKPNDELAISQQERKLHRNFQGYTTKPDAELFGFGLTSVSMLHDVYMQNHKLLRDYYQAIDAGNLPIAKGVKLDPIDILRREVILELMCNFQLDKRQIESKYQINFAEYFAQEEEDLQAIEQDGLINLFPDRIEVTPTGRLLIRNIAYIFDTHSRVKHNQRFSQSI